MAVANYVPESEEVLSLHEGEKVAVLDSSRENWWLVRKQTPDKKEGWVPGAYLQEQAEYDERIKQQLIEQIEQLPTESGESYVIN